MTDARGTVVAKGVINESSIVVMPGAEKTYPVSMRSLTDPWLPGEYTLTVSYRFDGGEESVVGTTKFGFIPTSFILGCLALPVIGVGGYVAWRRRNRRQKPPPWPDEECHR